MNTNVKNPPGGIRERRLAAGLSQEKLARLADCSVSTVRLAEHGWQPSEQMTRRLASALGCDPAELEAEASAARQQVSAEGKNGAFPPA